MEGRVLYAPLCVHGDFDDDDTLCVVGFVGRFRQAAYRPAPFQVEGDAFVSRSRTGTAAVTARFVPAVSGRLCAGALRRGIRGDAPAREKGAAVHLPFLFGRGMLRLLLALAARRNDRCRFRLLRKVLFLRGVRPAGRFFGFGQCHVLCTAPVAVVAEVDEDAFGGTFVLRPERHEQAHRKECGEVTRRGDEARAPACPVIIGSVIVHVPVNWDSWPG